MKRWSPACGRGGRPVTEAARAPRSGEARKPGRLGKPKSGVRPVPTGLHTSAAHARGTWLKALGSPTVIPEGNSENPFYGALWGAKG